MATTLKREDNNNFVAGDDVDIAVTVENVPSGVSIVKAWLTFKASRTAASFVVQKILTSGFAGTSTVTFTFLLTNADTAQFRPGTKYFFDVQVKTNNGKIVTPIAHGEATFDQQTTTETA